MPNTIIETERHGLWIAAAFILALLALGMSAVANKRLLAVTVGTQVEVLALDKRLDRLEKKLNAQAAAAAPVAVEAPAAPAAVEAPASK